MAAAQFEGEESDMDDDNNQVIDDGSEPSLLARGRSDKLQSIRNEVEFLVRRIVPDELGKVTTIMCPFQMSSHQALTVFSPNTQTTLMR